VKKIITLCLLAILFALNILDAQDTTHLLLKFSRPRYIGLYLAPEIQTGQLNNSFTAIGGGSAMLLLNQKWGFGIAGYRNLEDGFSPKGVAPLYLRTYYGGLKLEYTPDPTAAVHVTFPLMIGMGMARTDSMKFDHHFRGFDINNHNDFNVRNHNEAIIIQPGIQLEANMIRYLKLFGGANYRLAFNNSNATIPKNTFSGLSLNLGVKVGLFDYWIGKKQI
jgi:hypothetical protein